MDDPAVDPDAPTVRCSSWAEIVRCLDTFDFPRASFIDGEFEKTDWVFRGLADTNYRLTPAIERYAGDSSMPWLPLERLVTKEFKARARMLLSTAPSLDPGDDLTWLAMMQHYSVPTRLLDVTYSPYVALYFAIRQQGAQHGSSRPGIRLWAFDEKALNARFRSVVREAQLVALRRAGENPRTSVNPMKLEDFTTDGDLVSDEILGLHELISESLRATGTFRWKLLESGCVAVAAPLAFNPRLASQQGAFLINFAEELRLNESLRAMMATQKTPWCQCFDIAAGAIPDIERRLLQMNIHEQSLFPDMEGLAGLIRQKLRLQWR